jgi:plasmid stabilization system protein ParE
MRRFVLTSPAERDIDQIKAFLIQEPGATIARRVLREIRGAMEFLGREPAVGHVREDLTSQILDRLFVPDRLRP